MAEKRNVPQIRFAGFADEWDERSIGELTIELCEYDTLDSLYPLLTSSREGIMFQSEYRNNRTTENDSTLFSVVPRGKCTYRHMSDDDVFHFNINEIVEKGLVSREYPVFDSTEDNDLRFIVTLLNSSGQFRKFCRERKMGGTRTRLYYKSLRNFILQCPVVSEQKNIADFLWNINSLITKQQTKLEKLQTFKASMLGKMFPKTGADVPEVRFKGFTDAWKQRELGTIGKARSGVGFPDEAQGGTEGIPFFKVSDMNNDGNENEMLSANNYVSKEQITSHRWFPITDVPAIFFAKVGAAVMLNRKRLCRFPFLLDNNTMAYSLNKDSWNADFAKALFETIDLTSLVQVGALPSYNAKDVEAMEVCVPEMPEQKRIGMLFRSMDDLITLHQRELEKLKNIKKALLEKMFV